MFRKSFLTLMVLTIVVTLISGCAGQPTEKAVVVEKTVIVEKTVVVEATAPAPKAPIRLGVNLAFSGSLAYVGQGAMNGVTLALEELGGSIAGHPIQFYPADNACNPDDAVSAARRLVDVDKVDLILGSGCSSATLAVMPLLPDMGVAQIVGDSSSEKIYQGSGVGGNEWNFVYAPGQTIFASVFSSYMAKEVKSLAIMAYNDDFGRSGVNMFEPTLKALGVEISTIEYYDRGAPDFRPLLLKIKQSNPEGLFMISTEGDALVILRQIRELGLTQKLFGQGTIATPLFVEKSKGEPGLGEGLLNITWWGIGMDPEFDKAYQTRWGSAPYPNAALWYYVMRYVVAPAIEEADKTGTVDRASLRDALTRISVDSPMGHIQFDDHNQAYPNIAIITIKDGQSVTLEKVSSKP